MKKYLFLFICLSFNLFSSAQNLSDSLLLYYPFNGNALDASGNGFDGFISGVTDTTDRFGNSNSAFYFDGVDDYIELPNISELKPTDFPVTFSMWVFLKEYGVVNSGFFSTDFEENNYHGYWMNVGLEGNVGFGFGGGLGGTNASNKRVKNTVGHLDLENWRHMAGIIRSADDMTIYINCYDAGGEYNGYGPTYPAYSTTPGRIGNYDCSTNNLPYHFWGMIDDFMFWNRELSEEEIESLCDGATPTAIKQEEKETVKISYSESHIKILFSSHISELTIYNMQGQVIQQNINLNNIFSLNKSDLSSGIYIVEIKNKYDSLKELIFIE